VCPRGSRPALGVEELWHRHVPHGTGHATRQGRALMSPHIPRLQTRSRYERALPSPRATEPATWQGRVPVSPWVPCLHTPLSVWEGSGVATCPVPLGPPPDREGLRCHHVSCGPRPASWCGRAMASPRAPWLSASEACLCVPKAPDIRLIMASLGTRSRQRVKCVQDKPYAAYS
jgi:hypothetical protein